MALQLQRVLPGATLLESAATHLHQAVGGAPVRLDRFSGCGPQDERGLDGPSLSMDPAEMPCGLVSMLVDHLPPKGARHFTRYRWEIVVDVLVMRVLDH